MRRRLETAISSDVRAASSEPFGAVPCPACGQFGWVEVIRAARRCNMCQRPVA